MNRAERHVTRIASRSTLGLIRGLSALLVTRSIRPRHPGQIGIFVRGAKIASIGVRIRRWVSLHGVSLNVAPDLEHFSGIVPCGLKDMPVTSLAALGAETDMVAVDRALRAAFEDVFGLRPVSASDPRRSP